MIDPQQLVGTWRRFGPVGPVYQVVAVGQQLPDGNRMMRVRVPETEEEAEYKLFDILGDPKED